eukprot:scaffold46183_cov17-Tisochrysis_lutea.AAC.4
MLCSCYASPSAVLVQSCSAMLTYAAPSYSQARAGSAESAPAVPAAAAAAAAASQAPAAGPKALSRSGSADALESGGPSTPSAHILPRTGSLDAMDGPPRTSSMSDGGMQVCASMDMKG